MELDTRYIAGFFDGEGCVGIYGARTGRGMRHMLSVQLTQVDMSTPRQVLDLLREKYGGCVTLQATSSGRGKLGWQVRGDKAAAFLEEVAPHLVLKRAQAEIGAAWQRQRRKPRRGADGRMLPMAERDVAFNEAAADLVRRLKREELSAIVKEAIAIGLILRGGSDAVCVAKVAMPARS